MDNQDLVTYNFYNTVMEVIKSYGNNLPLEIATTVLKQISTEFQNRFLQQVNQKLTKLNQTQHNYGNKF